LDWHSLEIEKKRFMDQLLKEARSAYAIESIRQEAQAIAEDFLPVENEMLENVEGPKPSNLPHKENRQTLFYGNEFKRRQHQSSGNNKF